MYLFYNKRVARILGRFASSQVGIDRSAHARLDSIKVARAARTKVCAYMIYHPWWATVGDKRTFIHLAAEPRWDMYTWSNVRAPQRRNTVVNDTRDAPSRAKRVAWPRTVTRDENSACLFLIRSNSRVAQFAAAMESLFVLFVCSISTPSTPETLSRVLRVTKYTKTRLCCVLHELRPVRGEPRTGWGS